MWHHWILSNIDVVWNIFELSIWYSGEITSRRKSWFVTSRFPQRYFKWPFTYGCFWHNIFLQTWNGINSERVWNGWLWSDLMFFWKLWRKAFLLGLELFNRKINQFSVKSVSERVQINVAKSFYAIIFIIQKMLCNTQSLTDFSQSSLWIFFVFQNRLFWLISVRGITKNFMPLPLLCIKADIVIQYIHTYLLICVNYQSIAYVFDILFRIKFRSGVDL